MHASPFAFPLLFLPLCFSLCFSRGSKNKQARTPGHIEEPRAVAYPPRRKCQIPSRVQSASLKTLSHFRCGGLGSTGGGAWAAGSRAIL